MLTLAHAGGLGRRTERANRGQVGPPRRPRLTGTEIAEVLSRVLDRKIAAPDMTEQEALAAGMPAMGATHEWLNVAPQPARPEYARALGIPLTSFEAWARAHLAA